MTIAFTSLPGNGPNLNGKPPTEPTSDSWKAVDVEPLIRGILAGDIVGPVPTMMPRSDGPGLLYPGQLHSFAAEPESGKSWLTLAESARLISVRRSVLYLDFEDSPANIVERLLALGANADRIVSHFHLIRPEDALRPGRVATLIELHGPIALVVVDGVTEAMALLGLEISSNDDVAKFRAQLGRPLASHGAAVVEVDHVVKDKEARGRFALGGGHKLAGVAVAYGIEVIEQPSRAKAGLLKIIVQKDRHGRVRAHQDARKVIALARIQPRDDGATLDVTLDPPDGQAQDGAFRPTVLMERLSRAIEQNPAISTRGLRDEVKGKHEAKAYALDLLVEENYVLVEVDGQARRHHPTRPFREADDTHRAPGSQPCPDRAPAQVQGTVPPCPSPVGGTGTGHGPANQPNRAPVPNGEAT